jgi:hypothetical protein
MYEHLERLFQGLAPVSAEPLKQALYELSAELYRKLRQQIEITQNELRDGEQLEIYYVTPASERIQVTKIACLEPGLLVLYGTDDEQNNCKVLANLQTVQLTLKLMHHGSPEKQRPISFVEPTAGAS